MSKKIVGCWLETLVGNLSLERIYVFNAAYSTGDGRSSLATTTVVHRTASHSRASRRAAGGGASPQASRTMRKTQ
jgi:hypothetical protein